MSQAPLRKPWRRALRKVLRRPFPSFRPSGRHALILAFLTCLVLASVDQYWKNAPHPGFCPPDASWSLSTPDFARAWNAFSRLPLGAVCEQVLAPEAARLSRNLHHHSGIRPTPLRYRVWLGRQCLVWGKGSHAGLCLRPGLLARLWHWGYWIFRETPPDAIYVVEQLHYAWRDGFLLISKDDATLKAGLKAPSMEKSEEDKAGKIRIGLKHPYRLEAFVTLKSGLPFTMRLQSSLSAAKQSLPSHPASIRGSLAALSFADSAAMKALLARSAKRFLNEEKTPTLLSLLNEVVGRWGYSSQELATGIPDGPCTWVVGKTDTTSALPLPQVALLAPCSEASFLDRLDPLLHAFCPRRPCAWDSTEGWQIPLAGPHYTLCYAYENDTVYLSSQEPFMAHLLALSKSEPAPPADMRLSLNWPALAKLSYSLLYRAAQWELIGEMNPKDLETAWKPWIQILAGLGRLELSGMVESGGWLNCTGYADWREEEGA